MVTTSRTTTTALRNRTRLAAFALLTLGVLAALVWPATANTASTRAPTRTATTPTAQTTAATPATAVRRVTLLTHAGHLRHRYDVTRTGGGHCWTSSMVNGRLYRCFRGNFIHDPCWKLAGHRAVACLGAPWETSVTRIRLTTKLPARDTYGPALWGLRVSDGIDVDCLISQGAGGEFDGKHISYYCERGWVLLGQPHRSTPLWTMATARWRSDHFESEGTHHPSVAWKAVVH